MSSQSFLSETSESLAHATAIIGASLVERTQLISHLNISPFDTVILNAAETGGIKETREFANQLLLSPQFGSVRLGLTLEADKLSPQAQNALLKLLEEPPTRVKLILFISREADVLATVLSRCRVYYGSHAQVSEQVGPYLNDPIAQLLDAETLAKDEQVVSRVKGWLASEYASWCQQGRPVGGLDDVLKFWYCYRDIEAGINKRLLLEQLVISSL
ncbi:MAG TPA: hypothetical protein VGE59_04290 [Patescibacteria group bacterium]